ncbi:HRDC domain-containing protein [Enteractinococcus coprophilus]|uniref:HRDC domain-containing protein n=1 Tax=Enteractinococcus coprophilus TaxID=1027633 RepID=UPI00248305FB|nr:HRDC domain-containing protein [Enteractinococcus coprophilus]
MTQPAGGIPPVIDTPAQLHHAAEKLRAGTGPVAVDTERASGYRYGQRAFLIQLKRDDDTIWLLDSEALKDLEPIQQALAGVEWILHAAIQDLPSLRQAGLWPDQLFDTELAGRLLGYPRVSLSALLERKLNVSLAKEHSAADWSVRPLTEDMRNYAALDVELLHELREAMIQELQSEHKLEIAYEEFNALLTRPLKPPRKDPWRKTSGIHEITDRRALAIVRSLWTTREKLAQSRDLPPGKLLNDRTLIAVAKARPRTVPQLMKIPRMRRRAAAKDARRWLQAIQDGIKIAQDPDKIPPLRMASQAPPAVKAWREKDPLAARRLQTSRKRLARVAEEHSMPLENLLLPETLRELCWRPPEPITPESVERRLLDLGARPWQVQASSAVITVALLDPDPLDT